jgi:metal-responsive CopG/Arc/MetJ family transcriptional regulator
MELNVTVSIKVRKELVELADKMIKLGLAKSRSHAFNIMIERGLKEVELWENVYRDVEELKKQGFVLRHGNLNKLLEEDRAQ